MPRNLIFDLGGVLIDWDPKRLFRKIFETEEQVRYFLEHVCTMEWNEEQDGGRSILEGTQWLIDRHPDFETEINAYYGRWEEMLGEPIEGTLELIRQLKESRKYRLLALTNWSAETFPVAKQRYPFLDYFEGIVVSGQEGVKKPDPAIYQLICERFHIDPKDSLLIDDNLRNVTAAKQFGLQAVLFTSAEVLATYFISNKIM